MTFIAEMESLKNTNDLEKLSMRKIGLFIEKKAEEDPSIARNILKEKKSLEECYKYIKAEISKLARDNPVIITTDEPVYEMAIHYYDEDNIKIANPMQASDKKELKKVKVDKKMNSTKPERAKTKKDNIVDCQLNLFEV